MKSLINILIGIIIGAIIGVTVTLLRPDLIRPYIPNMIIVKNADVEGKVSKKGLEQDKLLLTVLTADGAVLITFDRNVKEVDLLVEEGDNITLSLGQYEPFVSNPGIKKVMKESQQKADKQVMMPEPAEPVTEKTESTETTEPR